MAKINRRVFEECIHYLRTTDPVEDGELVQDGDKWTHPGYDPPREYVWDASQETWIELHHWDNIRGKPDLFPPEFHNLQPGPGDPHLGKLDISYILRHNFRNNVHQRIMAAGMLGEKI